ncbi:unnamed protein product [Sphenostylis stenocarpa]|uniref:Uncharacterized protein n=1 Tax=Sphenostylis stenocarpa TaxID=92480 RepID=A0AA86S424_9FABA|nr:unnamed protein product [Sphenostylis stenocarpa]
MSKNSAIVALLLVILAIEACYGHSFSREEKKDQTIVVAPCKTKKDCFRNIRFLPCNASVVMCRESVCVCHPINRKTR